MRLVWHVIKNNVWFLVSLFCVAFAVRCVLFLSFTQYSQNALIPYDSAQYIAIAESIAAGKGIAQMYRVPGYSLFLALGSSAVLFQMLLAGLIPVLTFILGMLLVPSSRYAQIAACVSAVHVGLVLYAGMIATETLCALLILLFLICFVSKRWWIAGFWLGLASLVRPIGVPVLVVALVYRPSMRFLLAWAFTVSPWLIRNFLLTGSLVFHTLPGIHWVQYMAAPIVAQRDACDYAIARACVMQEWYSQCSGDLNDLTSCQTGERIAKNYIVRYPWYAFKHACKEVFKTVCGLYSAIILLADNAVWPSGYDTASWWTKIKRFLFPTVQRPFLIPLIYWDICVTILTLVGYCLFIVRSVFSNVLRRALFTTVPFVATCIGLTLAYGGARFRLPVEPLLLLGATWGWMYRCKK